MVEAFGDTGVRANLPRDPSNADSAGPVFHRPRHILLRSAAAGSLLLLLAILILWPVSYYRSDAIRYRFANGWRCEIKSTAARLGLGEGSLPLEPAGFEHSGYSTSLENAWDEWSYRDPSWNDEVYENHRLLGCAYLVTWCPAVNRHELYIPYSYLALLSAIMPGAWLLTAWRRSRRGAGVCDVCGYDLRGHAAIPNARCPECGTPVPAAPPPYRPA